jgi:hypothetical protein
MITNKSSLHPSKRMHHRGLIIFAAIVVLYYILVFPVLRPEFAFRYSLTHHGQTVYSNQAIGSGIKPIIDDAINRLQRVDFPVAKDGLAIFLLSSDLERSVFLFGSWGRAYAGTKINNEKIFINQADIAANAAFTSDPNDKPRPLGSVIAHEATHVLQARQFGLSGATLPLWKTEGYAEYIAGDTLIPYNEGIAILKNKVKDESLQFQHYFTGFVLTKFLLDEKKMSVMEFFTADIDRLKILDEYLTFLAHKNEP